MNYSKSLLLYEDKPEYGLFLRLIFTVVPAAMLIGSIVLFSQRDNEGSLALLAEAFIVGAIFWVVLPRKYQVYEDQIRIVLGGPFSIKVRFEQIKAIEITSRPTLSANFVTKFAKNCVLISKKRGLSIAITPRDNDSFIENANEAISQWAKARIN